MGKPPLTDDERRVKDLIRELHEAMQEGRQVLKELQSNLAAIYETEIRTALQIDLEAAAEAIAIGVDAVRDSLTAMETRIGADYQRISETNEAISEAQRDLLARVAGFQSKEESSRIFAAEANRLARGLAARDEFAQLVAAHAVTLLNAETNGELSSRARTNFAILQTLDQATGRGSVTVRLADEEHPPGLYDEHMRPLDIRIVPLSV